jgi:hypothetical protein
LQDWVANTDYECGCCGRPASEHIRVTSLCRILRETQQRENALIVENKKLKDQLEQASEQYRLSSVCRELKAENKRLTAQLEDIDKCIQQMKFDNSYRITNWPHDADPFTSPDHDNDSRNYQ